MQNWKIYVIGGAVLAFLIAIGCLVWFSYAGWWPIVLDVVLSFAALASLALLAALTVVAIYTLRLVMEVKNDIVPLLDSLKATSNTVRATASTASNFGVKPAVRTASFAIGAAEVASVILGRGRAQARADKRQKRRQQIEREIARQETHEEDGAGAALVEYPAVESPMIRRAARRAAARRGELNGISHE